MHHAQPLPSSQRKPDLFVWMRTVQDKRAINFNSSANSYDPMSDDPEKLCHGAYCLKAAACVSILDNTEAMNACAAVDVSTEEDTKVAMENCESAGAPGTAIYQPGIGVHEHDGIEHASVCRYRPGSMDLCPYTAGDGQGYVPNACVPAASAQDCSAAVLDGTLAENIAACETSIPGCEISAGACVPKTSACATADLSGTDAEDAAKCGLIPGCHFAMVAHDGDCTCPSGTTKVIPGSTADLAIDECQQPVYDGAPADVCSAPSHRLCGQDDGHLDGDGDDGLPGRHCTDFRRSFFCPDHVTENACHPLATAADCDGADSASCRNILGCKFFNSVCVPKTAECAAASLEGSDEQDENNCDAIDGCQLIRGTDDGFTCVDHNHFWLGDASCSCAYSNGLCESSRLTQHASAPNQSNSRCPATYSLPLCVPVLL